MAGAIHSRKGFCKFKRFKCFACKESLLENIIEAADFTNVRRIGRSFFVFRYRPRCRSPPHLKSGSTSTISDIRRTV